MRYENNDVVQISYTEQAQQQASFSLARDITVHCEYQRGSRHVARG